MVSCGHCRCLRGQDPIALLRERSLREARRVGEQLHAALTSRIVIEQAKGVLAERAQIGVDAAFVMLRAHAREKPAAAHQLIDGRLDPTTLANAPVTASSSRG